jgi:polysaccharide export outer membrane protein
MKLIQLVVLIATLAAALFGGPQAPATEQPASPEELSNYVLGPDDEIKIWALGLEEISEKPVRIDPSGQVDLPLLGSIRAAGLTVEQFKSKVIEGVAHQVREPQVSVQIVEFGSQPVSVIGAVRQPGVHQLRGRKSLAEVVSLAGGLSPEAGPRIEITRSVQQGDIPLPGVHADSTGRFNVAEVSVKELLNAGNPSANILIRPHDVIAVPRTEMVYVIGAIRKPGALELKERESISALQALSMAEGLGTNPAPQSSKILRTVAGSSERREIPIDLKKILAGKADDVPLQANDILFVPDSASKKASTRTIEAVIQAATGMAIWRMP